MISRLPNILEIIDEKEFNLIKIANQSLNLLACDLKKKYQSEFEKIGNKNRTRHEKKITMAKDIIQHTYHPFMNLNDIQRFIKKYKEWVEKDKLFNLRRSEFSNILNRFPCRNIEDEIEVIQENGRKICNHMITFYNHAKKDLEAENMYAFYKVRYIKYNETFVHQWHASNMYDQKRYITKYCQNIGEQSRIAKRKNYQESFSIFNSEATIHSTNSLQKYSIVMGEKYKNVSENTLEDIQSNIGKLYHMYLCDMDKQTNYIHFSELPYHIKLAEFDLLGQKDFENLSTEKKAVSVLIFVLMNHYAKALKFEEKSVFLQLYCNNLSDQKHKLDTSHITQEDWYHHCYIEDILYEKCKSTKAKSFFEVKEEKDLMNLLGEYGMGKATGKERVNKPAKTASMLDFTDPFKTNVFANTLSFIPMEFINTLKQKDIQESLVAIFTSINDKLQHHYKTLNLVVIENFQRCFMEKWSHQLLTITNKIKGNIQEAVNCLIDNKKHPDEFIDQVINNIKDFSRVALSSPQKEAPLTKNNQQLVF